MLRRFGPLALTLVLAACNKGDDSGETDVPDTDDTDVVGDGKLRFTILHTNDRHSHLVGFGPEREYSPLTTGDDTTVGGVARMKALIDSIREDHEDPVVLYDAGDWMAGTLFQEVRGTDCAELQVTQALGYDAITLGNHEFDWGPAELGQILQCGDENGVTVPIVASNTVPNPDDPADDALEFEFDNGRIESTHVQTLDNGLTLGLFGIVGDDAQLFAPAVVPSSFTPTISSTETAVADLEGQGVDIVIGITHNGVSETEGGVSPDEDLANAVDGIDILVGGHSHTPLFDYRTANGTVIVQAGSFTKWLGELNLAYDPETDTVEVEGYVLHDIDDTIAGDADIDAMVSGFKDTLDNGPLVDMGVTYDEPIVEVPGTLDYLGCVETGLGNLVADSYVDVMNDIDPDHPIDFAFQAQGDMRESLYEGDEGVQGFSDVFNMLPLGFGNDDRPGYAMVDFYVTGAELRDACEVTATISPDYGCSYWIELSSDLRCTMDMSFFPASRVYKVERRVDGTWEDVDIRDSNATMYHVAVDRYIASLMSIISDLSDGALVIVPKDENGAPYLDVDEMVFDANPEEEGVQELKMWEAFVRYSAMQPDTDGDGIPNIDDSYLTPGGRVVGYHL